MADNLAPTLIPAEAYALRWCDTLETPSYDPWGPVPGTETLKNVWQLDGDLEYGPPWTREVERADVAGAQRWAAKHIKDGTDYTVVDWMQTGPEVWLPNLIVWHSELTVISEGNFVTTITLGRRAADNWLDNLNAVCTLKVQRDGSVLHIPTHRLVAVEQRERFREVFRAPAAEGGE